MKNYILYFFTMSLLLASHFTIAGGGWPQKKGKGFFKFGQTAIIANKYFDSEGNVIDITTISLYTTSLYGEYGITDRITAIAYVPFFVRSTLNEVQNTQTGVILPGDELNAFGDTDIGIKIGLTHKKPVAVSASLIVGLPLGKSALKDQTFLQTGDGEFNQMVMVDAGRGFNKWYMNVGVGFNNRTQGFSDEFRYTYEIGYTGYKKLILTVKVNGVKPLNNATAAETIGNGVFANKVEYLAYGPEISYKIKNNFGVTSSAFFAVAAKRILASPNVGIGLFYTL